MNVNFCSEVRSVLTQLITLAITTLEPTERAAGFFFFQSYARKGAHILADVISREMSVPIEDFTAGRHEVSGVLYIASCCVIANPDVLSFFFGPDKLLLNQTIAIIAQTVDNPIEPLQASLEFVSAGIWRSGIAAERFISSVAAFQREGQQSALVGLVALCLRETKEPLRSVACLSVLESLLLKTSAPAFAQLIAIVRSHVAISELTAVVEVYSKLLADERSL
jgi:hypothetical protein